jgi:hypothetical protein
MFLLNRDDGISVVLFLYGKYKAMIDMNANPLDCDSTNAAISQLLKLPQSSGHKASGNLRLDYILPSCGIKIVDSGVFWPIKEDKRVEWIKASDHRMVYVDIDIDRSH